MIQIFIPFLAACIKIFRFALIFSWPIKSSNLAGRRLSSKRTSSLVLTGVRIAGMPAPSRKIIFV